MSQTPSSTIVNRYRYITNNILIQLSYSIIAVMFRDWYTKHALIYIVNAQMCHCILWCWLILMSCVTIFFFMVECLSMHNHEHIYIYTKYIQWPSHSLWVCYELGIYYVNEVTCFSFSFFWGKGLNRLHVTPF